ncbi:phosphoglycolate phosphatase [Piscirickettsia salmonis]|uniref:pyrimidine 5'-nucleotidase n=1 Tax=Piscirickettsia salmonis TaxID=1238 RepID=UPI0012BAAF9F|nr:pyrimidine 5'-nucleotidase [Piscirickettsia salmonis]QGP54255.1 phosphoglycolate phosphatase [Piscirickettsia salmonis]QGP59848.1 phosphoglycolate phosphatase [Piscirickettsia salmonis]QGP63832.1 phosphoglycolate phosphatase [Piscirickettsia salmonis]
MLDWSRAKNLVFDLDNTLYDASTLLFNKIEVRMNQFIRRLLNIDEIQAHKVQKDYYRDYGTTLKGLVKCNGINPDDFLEYVHDIDASELQQCRRLATQLQKLPHQKYVYTNGSVAHAKNILTAMGTWTLFSGIFDIKQANFQAKPYTLSYQLFCQQFDLKPEHCIFIEDMSENLLPAADLGMQTVLIRTASTRSMQYADDLRVHLHVDSVHEFLMQAELMLSI